ncbi:hypothetical protein ID866_9467 [Astraeus odoratus]|nr:hypothetical protein ID866_9467 [Astraeus odoratus]
MSFSVTVGRTFSKLFKKSCSFKGGSSNSSDSTSFHDFSTASGSPGEHGVHLVFVGEDDGDGGAGLKWVAEITFRTGCMRASRTTMAMSEPEYLVERASVSGGNRAEGGIEKALLTLPSALPTAGSPSLSTDMASSQRVSRTCASSPPYPAGGYISVSRISA